MRRFSLGGRQKGRANTEEEKQLMVNYKKGEYIYSWKSTKKVVDDLTNLFWSEISRRGMMCNLRTTTIYCNIVCSSPQIDQIIKFLCRYCKWNMKVDIAYTFTSTRRRSPSSSLTYPLNTTIKHFLINCKLLDFLKRKHSS